MDYLQKIMDFTLVTLQKLSSPAKEDELKANCQKLFGELADICMDGSENSFILALVRGLRFVLEEMQVNKFLNIFHSFLGLNITSIDLSALTLWIVQQESIVSK